uniref:valine--tRNA ligase n=1 Tax=Guillardia theta TaxID=55529 RepID=A0A7S4P865_GUITH|mmetsp:Transcript_4517/g.16505  ORF Transcript_4517/g.16505 Transcript_4517/m.16505 type:complete len:187 (+) Transcript_4517:38-598(+)
MLTLPQEKSVIATLVKADEESMRVETVEEMKKMLEEENKKGLSPVHVVVQDGLEAFLPLSGLVDLNKELARLSKQQTTLEKEVETLVTRMSSPGFADKAPKAVVDEANAQLADKREQLNTINSSLEGILAQMPPEEAEEWRKTAAAEKAAAEEAARLKAEAAAKKKAEAAAKKAEQAAKKAAAKME